MPSETEEHIKDRYTMEAIEAMEIVAKEKKTEDEAKANRKKLKERYLSRDLSFDEMFKQSCARVYFMKTNRNVMVTPTTVAWSLPPVADKLLSRFKYNKKKADEAEALVQAAIRVGSEKQVEEYKVDADKYLTKCLHAHYGIGVLYGQFLDGVNKVVTEDPQW